MLSAKRDTHQIKLDHCKWLPEEVPVGADVSGKIKASCIAGCDLTGGMIRLMEGGDILVSDVLTTHDPQEDFTETSEITVTAPKVLGDHSWVVIFPSQEISGAPHEEALRVLPFKTKPQSATLATWGIASPVVTGHPFRVTVGAKSAGKHNLAGARIEVLDESETVIGASALGDVPWPGTNALYWTDVELSAPQNEGVTSWLVRFVPGQLPVPHADASARFSFAAIRPPEVRISIRAIQEGSGMPIPAAHVRLGSLKGETNGEGVLSLAAPKGIYQLAYGRSDISRGRGPSN